MARKLDITPELITLFKEQGKIISFAVGGKTEHFLYLPFWIKMEEHGDTELLDFSELPDYLVDHIKEQRNKKVEHVPFNRPLTPEEVTDKPNG